MDPTTSGAAAGAAGWKLIGGLAGLGAIGAALAFLVVMCMSDFQSKREWRAALISTVMASIGGCAFVVMHYNLQHWADSPFGLIALGGLFFSCGLPGWLVVRLFFNWSNKHKNSDLLQAAKEVKEIL